MKILINVPSLKLLGGVANHYLGLKNYWSNRVEYNVVGKRNNIKGSGVFWLPFDIVKFVYKLMIFRPDIVVLNPSMGKNALMRDFIFLDIVNAFNISSAIYIHGFDVKFVKSCNAKWLSKNFNKSSLVFVLAKSFKHILTTLGVNVPMVLSSTKVDDKLLEDFDVKESRLGDVKNILFLARLEKNKGVEIAVKCYEKLKEIYPKLRMTIVGDGSMMEPIKRFITKNAILDITLTGMLSGKNIEKAYKEADLYILPTYHAEGMPTSVLEAMAFGLPVFTRKVGGLNDFFDSDKMGFITDSLDYKDFVNAIIPYIENPTLCKKVSQFNASYAHKHFLASVVAHSIEEQLKQYV